MIFLFCIIDKDDISFSRKYDFTPRRKTQDDPSQKNTPKYDIFFKCSEKMVFSKRIALGYDLSGTIWKGCIFPPENMITFPWTENEREMIFLKKYTETWYFLCTRVGVTNVTPRPPAKKNQRLSYPAKIHLKVIEFLDWHFRKSSSNSLYFHGYRYRCFHILLSSKKNQET